jgi:hypothetical protein
MHPSPLPQSARRARTGTRLCLLLTLVVLGAAATGLAQPRSAAAATYGPVVAARASEPVVLTGSQVPQWSRSAAQCVGQPYPSGVGSYPPAQFQVRTAHNGTCVVPPDTRTGVDPNQVAAYRWTGSAWKEVPVQVDQKFPYFLANDRSSFSFYSGTDQELTYSWAPDAHSTGEEAWKKMWGTCSARYAGAATLAADISAATAAGYYTPGPQETPADYTHAMTDPVSQLNDDDEIVFMARDAGNAAPVGTAPPAHAGNGQTVTLVDPTDGATSYVYLFTKPGGSKFKAITTSAGTISTNGYVDMQRNSNANEWIDRYTFAPSDPQKLGTSNTGYGPNLPGTVCRTAAGNDANPPITTPDGSPRHSTDRFPRDGLTVTTPTYKVTASGRWMVNGFQVTAPGKTGAYGPSLIARWKGRAFQSSPDSQVSVVGFEDEQVNWEANSALLGWKVGPVRAIREIWGADSGTNVTKTELYYRDADSYSYHVRVHPIPPDGLYTSWDYNLGAASTYYNLKTPNGVPIDGINDNVGYVDQVPGTGTPAYFNSCDPTFAICSAVDNPEEVAGTGSNGSLVYMFQFTSPTSAVNPAAVPYYRDDACFDDGTGNNPVPRPWPGNASTDAVVQQGYVAYWRAKTGNQALQYSDLRCNPQTDVTKDGTYTTTPFQGAIAEHGIHFFMTGDTDNATQTQPIDELDGQQWRFSVPTSGPSNIIQPYAADLLTPLQAAVTPYGVGASASVTVSVGATATAAVLPLPLIAIAGVSGRRRRRR